MISSSARPLFKAPREHHTIILARGQKIRHWSVRPGALLAGVALTSTALLGCLASATLFFLGDDVATAFQHREARTVAAYEERISSLRQQLEQATSRQFSERDQVRTRVERLIGEHEELALRFDQLEPLFKEARSAGLMPGAVPTPSPRPDPIAVDDGATPSAASAFAGEKTPAALDRFEGFDLHPPGDKGGRILREVNALGVRALDFQSISGELIPTLSESMERARSHQDEQIARLTVGLRQRASSMERVLETAGVAVPSMEAVGGPLVPAPDTLESQDDIAELAYAIAALEKVSQRTKRLPLGRPVDAAFESSSFGVRQDPFLNRRAFHTGLDFAAATGSSVRAAAPGKVVSAGYAGGYGRMVEIDHGGGFRTRYAHLSSIHVAKGDLVEAETIVGEVGSSGRSTGPHLHYEVKREGKPIDPRRFLNAGEILRSL